MSVVMLTPYQNHSGNSGVVAYELLRDGIRIKFVDEGVYTYTNLSAGMENVERMKALAKSGKGLSGYITRHVREQYAVKEARE